MKPTTLQWLSLPIFFLACFVVAYFGSIYTPGEWYESLNRAPWSPPNIAFPIVWGILYCFIAISGWWIFLNGSKKQKTFWCLQLTLNAVWSWVFFGQHWVGVGLLNLILLMTILILLILSCWQSKLKLPFFLLLPYSVWLIIAISLNAYILLAN